MNAQNEGLDYMRRNIDAWWPFVMSGVEAVVVTASGCGTMVSEYGYTLRNDGAYAEKAARISALFRDLSQVIASEKEALTQQLKVVAALKQKLAFHSPCSLQHGLKIKGVVEGLLRDAGYVLTNVPDSHLCCGSAGTYSVLQADLACQLRDRKLANLHEAKPQTIISANIGCITHLQSGTATPVKHWVELLDQALVA